ncbi:MAG: EAL domain-containing protein [Denitrovibrio sp.]|nr:MAG: EAL domain-containing protein [Denitrovibrio sp.]
MSCNKCTTTPILPSESCDFYVSASHDYILEKLADNIPEYKSERMNDYLFFNADADEFFQTNNFEFLNLTEKENLHMLILKKNTQPSFSHFSKTKTLEAWITLYKSMELIWLLKEGRITTFFQPIVNTSSLEIFGYECLSRGVTQSGEYMPPDIMFGAAKTTGMLFNLDRQCREAAIKTSAIKKIDKNIFINFLPTAIYNPEFCLKDTVMWLDKFEFEPSSITFEVVETEEITNTAHLQEILTFYKSKGYNTALDDMGSGYSSLNLLSALSPDIVKIDMELIRDIDKNSIKQSIVEGLIAISNGIGYKMIAEGIETKEEYEWIKEKGIDYVQGYYFAKPSPEPVRIL